MVWYWAHGPEKTWKEGKECLCKLRLYGHFFVSGQHKEKWDPERSHQHSFFKDSKYLKSEKLCKAWNLSLALGLDERLGQVNKWKATCMVQAVKTHSTKANELLCAAVLKSSSPLPVTKHGKQVADG